MSSKSHLSLASILVGLAFTLSNFGCGGGEQTAATLPGPISVSVSPASANVQAGGTQQFTATVANDSANKGVSWSVSCSAAPCGSVSPTSTASGAVTTYTARSTAPASSLTVTLTATSVADTTKYAAATITTPAPISVAVSPASATVQAGTTQQFTATVANDSANGGVSWSVSCSAAPCGSVSPTSTASGAATTYSAPSAPPASNLTVTVTATSVSESTVSAAATVTVLAPSVMVSANSGTVEPGTTAQLTAVVSNYPNNSGVTWSLSCSPSSSSCGTVSPTTTPSGVATTYTAPPTSPASGITVKFIATLLANPAVSNSETLTVPPPSAAPISVSVSPTSATINSSGTQQFAATVTNDSANKGVTWSVSCLTAPCGSVSPTSTASRAATTYTAPSAPPASNLTVTITATSVSDTTKSGAASVTIPALVVAITVYGFPGPPVVVEPGATVPFSASVSNYPSNSGVDWSVSCSPATSPCGTVSPTTTPSGVQTTYTAPPTSPPAGLAVTVTAASVADPAVSSSLTLTVLGITVSITPNPTQVEAGATTQLTATVTDDPKNEGVNWTMNCTLEEALPVYTAPCGSLSAASTPSGTPTTYTAPQSPPISNLTVNVTATSVAYSQASTTAILAVPAITISIAPGSVLLPVNITQQFTATVGNDYANRGSTWAATEGGSPCSPGCGTVVPSTTASGSPTTYTAPANVPANSPVTVAATSVTDTTKTANAAVTLTLGTVKLVPTSLSFGNGMPGTQTAALTNTGNGALSITGITFIGNNPSDFGQTNTCGTSVAAGVSCTITVEFNPSVCGVSYTATLSINDSSADTPQQISLSGTGPKCKRTYEDRLAVRSALARSRTAAVPTPSGASNVGTRVMDLVDSTREDPFLANDTERELLVRFWYPAPSGQVCQRAGYTSPGVWNYFSQLVGVSLPYVSTNSCLNAPTTGGTHPVVVFTPGYTGTFTDYTFLFEDLASRGYIVASVDHTYEATAVEFPDGRLVKSALGSHLDGTWRLDDEAFSFCLSVRLGDLEFVVSELERLNSAPDSPFSGKLDVSRIALAGHSFGGLTTILGVEQEPRFKAGILIDGVLANSSAVGPTDTPVLLLAAGRKQWSDAERRLWGQLQGSRLAVNLKGAEHVAPSDGVWLAEGAIKAGPMGAEKIIAAVRDYIAAFLDANLLDKPMDPLLSGPSSEYPDVEVITQDQLLPGKP